MNKHLFLKLVELWMGPKHHCFKPTIPMPQHYYCWVGY